MQTLAQNIKKARLEVGLSQSALGKRLSVTRQAVSNWENGKSLPDVEMLTRIAAILGVDIAALIYGEKAETAFGRNKAARIRRFAIFAAITALIAAAAMVLLPIFKGRKELLFDPFPYAALRISSLWLLYGLAPVCLLSLLSIWRDITMANMRRLFLGAGCALVIGCIALHVLVYVGALPSHPLYWLWEHPQLGAAISILLFLALND